MRKTTREQSWVVYRMRLQGTPIGAAVCGQSEWDAMERADPGRHVLIRGDIASEAEAEALARESSGFVPPGPRTSSSHSTRRTPGPKRAAWRGEARRGVAPSEGSR